MTAALLLGLRARGIRVDADGDRLRYHPANQVTAADVDSLRAGKADLLALLGDLASLDADRTAGRLRALAATLTPAERERLWAEAGGGDHLAGLIVAVIGGFPAKGTP